MDVDLLSSYAGLLSLAVVSITAGAFGSLPTPKQSGPSTQAIEDDEDEDDMVERVSSGDAWLFPVMGSATLFGLYLVMKYLGKEWINWLLGWYFSLAGIGSVWKSLTSLARALIGREQWRKFEKNRVLVLRGPREIIALSWRTPSLFLFPLGALPSVLYTFSRSAKKSALLTDILALSFSHNALSLLKIDSFTTGCILLSGLFVYDIWWVFGTEVMVKVATNLDVPIKLLWPKSVAFSTDRGFTMLGLGDVVIPGIFVALALRYDYDRYSRSSGRSFTKPYFYATLAAYIAGLSTTMAVMHIFRAAQPALLYLSPACIMAFILTATVRGELTHAWKWSDSPAQSGDDVKQILEKEKASNEPAAKPSPSTVTDGLGVPTPQSDVSEAEADGDVEAEQEKGKKKKIKKKTELGPRIGIALPVVTASADLYTSVYPS
ncbi:hypothetical protein EW146_g9008 [Bondarzewia mesenterica]|uniref:Peptidase A22B, signal peptide peptidase n=1 Tax=Bondarzewia mesenterica TaxID=1095465 RepID=A0A4S4L9X4_9AGAM|nr:hypothetical protein EW146_g9008 [Bondarzewia mesenterica]